MCVVEVEAELGQLLGAHRVGLPYALLGGEEASVALFCAAYVVDCVYAHLLPLREVLRHHDELVAALVGEAVAPVEVELVSLGA